MASSDPIQRVREARARLEAARVELEAAIHAAEAGGETQRAIGEAAGLTLQQVWLVLREQAHIARAGIRRI